jgi:acyl-CoA thioester hydrolase
LIRVRTVITELGGAHIDFRYEISLAEADHKLIATGSSRHAFVNGTWRPTRIPADLRKLLQPHLEK